MESCLDTGESSHDRGYVERDQAEPKQKIASATHVYVAKLGVIQDLLIHHEKAKTRPPR
jgi:hypothetical protein